MNCWDCRFANEGACLMQVNLDMYSQDEACPCYRSKQRLALWASRHPLDQTAKASMRPHDRLVEKEIIWPEGEEDCLATVARLVEDYDVIYGVFPAQAVSAIMAHHWSAADECYYPGYCRFYSAVSVPVKEQDTGRTRCFEFVRWALLI